MTRPTRGPRQPGPSRARPARVGPTGLFTALLVAALTGCAGGTVGSGVGEIWLDRPPYYAGQMEAQVSPGSRGTGIAYTRVAVQEDAAAPSDLSSAREGTPLRRLLDAMNDHLDGLGRARGWSLIQAPEGPAPDVLAGCALDAWDGCAASEDALGTPVAEPRFRLAVTRPSADWQHGTRQALASTGAEGLLTVTLEVGHYWPRQADWKGAKVVDLGTDRTVSLPWLTALDAPIAVLQVTGVLTGPDGRARRIGAEGIRVRRTPIALSGFGVQAMLRDDDVEAVLGERAGNRPGDPFIWQVALEALVDHLTRADFAEEPTP